MRAVPIFAAALAVLSFTLRPVAGAPGDPSVGKAPLVTVVDSPLAERWLDQAGIAYTPRTGASLGSSPVTGTKLLILPMQAVTTAAAVTNIQDYLNGGGKLIAVYWGTVAPDGAAMYPAYQLCPQLGIRPIGWMEGPPGRLSLASGGNGALPYFGAELDLPNSPAIVVQPLPGALPVARWTGAGAGEVPSGYVGAVYLRGGSVYLAPNVLRGSGDSPASRELLFWAIQRVAPDFGPNFQARDRIAAAAAVMATLNPLLDAASPAEITAGANIAQAALTEARGQLSKSAPARATSAADRARRLATDLIDRLKRERAREEKSPAK